MIIASIKSFSHFKEIEKLVDGIIISSSFSISINDKPTDEEMIKIIKYSNEINKLAIIDISSLMTNEEIKLVDNFINKYKDFNVSFIYTDIGVYNILKKYNIESRGIYDPKTLITNSFDMNYYLDDNIMAIGLSNEIPAKKIKEINSKKHGKTLLKIFGYHQMFYSKRHLISTYLKYKNMDNKLDMNNTYLKEETRGEEYHIDENSHGTVIYRSYVMSYMKCLDDILGVDYLVFDSSFIDDKDFTLALKIYSDVLNGLLDKNIAYLKLKEIFNIEDGFMIEDTVYVKEEMSRWDM